MLLAIELLQDSDDETEPIESLIQIRCVAHILNIVVHVGLDQEEVEKSISKIRYVCKKVHSASKIRQLMKEQQRNYSEDKLEVIMDVETRWNSTHAMIKRAIRLKQSLTHVSRSLSEKIKYPRTSQNQNQDFVISEQNWLDAAAVVDLFEPFDQSTNDLSAEKKSVISQAYIIFSELKNHLQKCLSNKKFVRYKLTIKAMQEKLEEYWLHNKKISIICCLLDPRLKLDFLADEDKQTAIDAINELYEQYSTLKPSDDSQSINSAQIKKTSSNSPSMLDRLFLNYSSSENFDSCSDSDEIKLYLQDVRIKHDDSRFSNSCIFDLVKWWGDNQSKYKILSKRARDYLSIMPTSAPSERAFSAGGLEVSKLRCSLHPESVRQLVCLKSWNNNAL